MQLKLISISILVFALGLIPLVACTNSGSVSNKNTVSDSSEIIEENDKPISEMTEEELLNSKEFKTKMRELAPIYAKQKVQFKMLCSEWTACKSNKERRKFIADHEYEVGLEFDVDISTISKAENLFVTHPEEFMKAMELKLKARAARELADENYQKAYELRYSE